MIERRYSRIIFLFQIGLDKIIEFLQIRRENRIDDFRHERADLFLQGFGNVFPDPPRKGLYHFGTHGPRKANRGTSQACLTLFCFKGGRQFDGCVAILVSVVGVVILCPSFAFDADEEFQRLRGRRRGLFYDRENVSGKSPRGMIAPLAGCGNRLHRNLQRRPIVFLVRRHHGSMGRIRQQPVESEIRAHHVMDRNRDPSLLEGLFGNFDLEIPEKAFQPVMVLLCSRCVVAEQRVWCC